MNSDTDSSQSTSENKIQNFTLAHPPPSKRTLRLAPHLSLQIQQLNVARRPIPILEIYQPSCFGKTLAGGPRKLGSRDMYLVQSEGFTTHLADRNGTGGYGAVVGAIYVPLREEEEEKKKKKNRKKTLVPGGVWFPFGDGWWEVTSTSNGGTGRRYRFVFKSEGSRGVELQWEKRSEVKGDRFVLRIADSKLATLTRKGLKVGGWDCAQRDYLSTSLRGDRIVDEDTALYTCVLTMGVYVAAQENWLN
ncbi:hypothetical protein BDV28DRAFT_25125 [Aspergillus coremiiformis]|uniref:Tubby C-terminal-like domain-containing protein n=1 Tax=Aspergillus coremiiformis TaxID=138285 RepID=A0A5N6Z351_9EURO|nr:hypothetical protein BDV28DRAFT_25125 [Aspergillus coremiiformis]